MQDASRLPSDRRTARIGKLAVLPVFLSLKGKRAVVAGGSAAAAWKAELLAAAGARVDLYAPLDELCDLFQDLIGHADPQIAHHDRHWTADILNGAAIAICDAASDGEAQAFFGAARVAGVPVNVIDRPEFCQFQFGTIVNRSPVVVGVSTAGASPILGQAIRRRIETLLPASLGAWASLAETIRGAVMARLDAGAQRRNFWERFSDRAFGAAPTVNDEHELTRNIDRISVDRGSTIGRVTLVGAGPGDAELLTLKAVRALQAADIILFDDLVSDEVLELARREAARIMVGNPSGHKNRRHEDITDLMVKLAKAGKRVIRLESGEPMSAYRANGEIERLKAEGIPVDVVPGITFRNMSNARLIASGRARQPFANAGASQIADASDGTNRPLCGIHQTMPPPPEATAGRSPATFLR
ncbi:SAM-dependent methyltransferase [Mesorhizobium sp. ZC-5]|uniref:SAM-dependent methyltransferase n=1 Tax=Mesorhizobium sp. ZC-5 TaxID=2986066 RepID=UPI0021E86833|nr:SAM-dependent methyltransferase [Mesorhizobium sp. ZC-5]MCV3238657.1 SAM-dependent methyltransferase [Mesorhizobium sp. ZC-5]